MARNQSTPVAHELDEMYDTPQFAERLKNVSPRTIERWRNTGTGPAFVKVGHRVLYRKSAIQQWLRQRTKTHTNEQPRAPRGRRQA